MVYQFTRRARQNIIKVLKPYFEEAVRVYDGYEWLEIPQVHVVDAEEWDSRLLPAIVTQNARGRAIDITIGGLISELQDTTGEFGEVGATYEVRGGQGAFTLELLCASNSQKTQQLIADRAAFLLTLLREQIYNDYLMLLSNDISVAEAGKAPGAPEQESVWITRLSVSLTADFRILVRRDTISQIVVL